MKNSFFITICCIANEAEKWRLIMKTHLIMPMGGAGSRFVEQGIDLPKPMIAINDRPFFFWAAMSIVQFVKNVDITFVTLKEHIDVYGIDRQIKQYFPEADIISLPSILPGPVFTCLEGIRNIEDDGIVIFNDCDHMFKSNQLNRILNIGIMRADSALVTFKSREPQFSFIQYDTEGNIIGTVEKEVVSDSAICGAYVFRDVNMFKKSAEMYIGSCPYKECFMSGLYNVLYDAGSTISVYLADFHVTFGTPDEYRQAKDSPCFSEILFSKERE